MKNRFRGKKIILLSGGYAYRKAMPPDASVQQESQAHLNQEHAHTREQTRLSLTGDAKHYRNSQSRDIENNGTTRLFEKLPAPPKLSKKSLTGRGGKQESLFMERTKPRSFVVGVILVTLLLLVVMVGCAGFMGIGAVVGIAGAYVNTTPDLNIGLIEDQDQTSLIYDNAGKLITTYTSTENREWATIEEIPEMLQHAFIAIEDSRFEQHEGVDFKRLFKVVFDTLRNVNSGGGSTITQQLIKLRVIGNDPSYKRKIQEAYLALELETKYTKPQILEAYLNAVHFGESNYGVKAAAMDYFGKELKELTIRECAMLAGIINRPSKYNPRKNMYIIKDMTATDKRTDDVLAQMYALGHISLEEYHAALEEDVAIVENSKVREMYDMPYFVEYAMHNVITCMLESRDLIDNTANRSMIEKELRTSGYKIYLTVDTAMQLTLESTVFNWEDYPALRDPSQSIKVETLSDGSLLELPQPQASAVIIDHETFQVKALVGGRHQPTQLKQLNRAYKSRMPVGSSVKPLSVYAPALDKGAYPSDVILNFAQAIPGYGNTEERGYPLGGLSTQGPVTMRYGVQKSLNVVAARVLIEKVGLETSKQYLINLGINESGLTSTGAGLALGTVSISPLEMAAAYATLANGGVYMEPIAFTKVLDSKGNVILDSQTLQHPRQVFKETTAWLMTSILEDAVRKGTGTPAKIENMTVAGKTGTNEQYTSVYFAGYTPYYASALWIGHDDYRVKLKSGSTGGADAAPLWQAYMAAVHEGLEDKSIQAKTAEQLGFVKREICTVSGLMATDACKLDTEYKPAGDWFLVAEAPQKSCDMHVAVNVCSVSGHIANAYCPVETVQKGCMLIIPDDSEFATIQSELLDEWMPDVARGITKAQLLSMDEFTQGYGRYYCTLHNLISDAVYDYEEGYDQLRAQRLLDAAHVYSLRQSELLTTEAMNLSVFTGYLENAMYAGDIAAINTAMDKLEDIIDGIERRLQGNSGANETEVLE